MFLMFETRTRFLSCLIYFYSLHDKQLYNNLLEQRCNPKTRLQKASGFLKVHLHLSNASVNQNVNTNQIRHVDYKQYARQVAGHCSPLMGKLHLKSTSYK